MCTGEHRNNPTVQPPRDCLITEILPLHQENLTVHNSYYQLINCKHRLEKLTSLMALIGEGCDWWAEVVVLRFCTLGGVSFVGAQSSVFSFQIWDRNSLAADWVCTPTEIRSHDQNWIPTKPPESKAQKRNRITNPAVAGLSCGPGESPIPVPCFT